MKWTFQKVPSTLSFLNLPVGEVQETSDWRTDDWNVMSEQRKSNWQHPNAYHREREETPGNDECDTSQHPHPYRTLPTKPVQIMADPNRDVILEAVHFLVEIGNPRHARLSGMLSIRSYCVTPHRRSQGSGSKFDAVFRPENAEVRITVMIGPETGSVRTRSL
jgi:hypothetical protein